jgi:hypothetical protein
VQDGDTADHLLCDDALLLVGDQQFKVQADGGRFLPDTGSWGGVLRHIPPPLASTAKAQR